MHDQRSMKSATVWPGPTRAPKPGRSSTIVPSEQSKGARTTAGRPCSQASSRAGNMSRWPM
ncbi:MAG: hypothetical protein MZV64_34560 [Ignavibacteriales bacterium]|nr:hypothetical protein [Ignavibacteriales bacterium]